MVYLCNSIAALSPHVEVDVIDADEFPELVSRYQVSGVPKILINDTAEVLEVVPVATLIGRILAATSSPAAPAAAAAAPPPSAT
jgi:hypothetical protein